MNLEEMLHVARLLSKLMKMPGTNMDLKMEVARKLRARAVRAAGSAGLSN